MAISAGDSAELMACSILVGCQKCILTTTQIQVQMDGETSLCPLYIYVRCERLSDCLGPTTSPGDWAHGTLQDVGSKSNLDI